MKFDTVRFVRSAFKQTDLIQDGLPEIAFAGRSNVGKSSLLNRLLARKRLARTSSTPGRTRAINYFLIDDRFYFVDLPGYGYAKVGKELRRDWARLMESYFETRSGRCRVVQLVDAKVGATDLDVEAYRYFAQVGAPPIVVATKIDKLPRDERPAGLARVSSALAGDRGPEVLPFSARSVEGVKQLSREITAFLRQMEEPSHPTED